MRKLFAIAVGILALAGSVCASGKNLAWDIPATVTTDGPTAQALVYTAYVDGGAQGQVLSGVTCTASGTPVVVTCQTLFPFVINGVQLTNGSHNFQLTLANPTGPESPQSAVASFTVEVTGPGNVRVK